MPSIDRLNRLLAEAGHLLDEASIEIRDMGIDPEQNIRKIAEALVNISEIQLEVYQRRPDLMPDYLKK